MYALCGRDSRSRLRERRVIKRQKFGTQHSLVLLSQVSTALEGEIMQCLQAPPLCDLSVLERQRARLNWQQQQQQLGQEEYLPAYNLFEGDYSCMQSLLPMQASFHGLQSGGENNESHGHVNGPLGCVSNGWPYLASTAGATTPVPGAAIVEEASTVAVSNGSSRKRKPENSPKSKQLQETGRDDSKSKRVKEETGGSTSESKQSNMNKEAASADTSKEKGKSDKADYIHVRARRGQATDSHSLAERVRRERISQRMQYLQDLVPGCSKITGKAGMLDEIINYVQSLQRQVEFLSMKLAAVNPMMDISIDSFFGREINPACKSGSSPEIRMLSELPEQPYLQFSSLQSHPCPGLDMFMDSHCSDMQANSAAVAVPLPDASFGSCINVNGPTVWNTNLQNLHGVEFQLGRVPAFPIQSLQGSLLPNNLKMEM